LAVVVPRSQGAFLSQLFPTNDAQALSTFNMAYRDCRRVLVLVLLAASSLAHEHHDKPSEEEAKAPIDRILWIHMALQALVWGVMFPTGMVLGLSKSKWHVPLQVSLSYGLLKRPLTRNPI
jgi:cytochrome bd-type quinol oxidase subunit 2